VAGLGAAGFWQPHSSAAVIKTDTMIFMALDVV
jgi:hypothetical protein